MYFRTYWSSRQHIQRVAYDHEELAQFRTFQNILRVTNLDSPRMAHENPSWTVAMVFDSRQAGTFGDQQRGSCKKSGRPTPAFQMKGRCVRNTYEKHPWLCGGRGEDEEFHFYCWPCLVMASPDGVRKFSKSKRPRVVFTYGPTGHWPRAPRYLGAPHRRYIA